MIDNTKKYMEDEREKHEKVVENWRIFNEKKKKEYEKKEKLIIEFLKKNSDNAFTLKEIYDQFSWEYIGINELVDILEKHIPYHYSFKKNNPGVVILEIEVHRHKDANMSGGWSDIRTKGFDCRHHIYYKKVSLWKQMIG